MEKYLILQTVKNVIGNFETQKQPMWFNLSPHIKKISVPNQNTEREYNNVDIVIATAVQTVKFVKEKFNCKKIYFIQGLETWGVSKDYLYETYANKMKKVVVSQWLKEIVDQYSALPATVIKNPIDTTLYKVNISFEKRKKHSVALLYNELPTKGFSYAIEAVYLLKEKYPDLTVNMFGRRAYPEKLPPWIKYTINANQSETINIYNISRVYMCASIEEGYGLTGLEAMACGCVLVSTNYNGVQEYAVDNINALLSPVKSVEGLIKNTEKAFNDLKLCQRIVKNGLECALQLSWEKALEIFNKIISQ